MLDRKNRITLLSSPEIDELYNLPNFNRQDMEFFFSLSDDDYLLIAKYRTTKLKIYFILQLGYFRATHKFYNFKLEDVSAEVAYLTTKYFDNSVRTIVNSPYRVIIKSQQEVILKLHNYTDWSNVLISKIMAHLAELIRYYPKVEIALSELLKYFESERIVVPSYRILQDIFTKVLSNHEVQLNHLILSIPQNIQTELDKIIGTSEDDIDKDSIIVELNTIRYDQKDFKYTAANLEIQKVKKIAPLYKFAKLFLPTLNISKNSIRHYSDLTENYSASRLRKLRKPQQFLYILCFIYHRYQQFMDNLIITFQYHVNVIMDKGKEYAQDAFTQHSTSLILDFPNLAKFLKWFPAEDKKQELTYHELSKKAYKILPKSQFEIMALFLEGKIFDKTKAQWEFYSKTSALLSRYLRPIMLNVDFEFVNYKSDLVELIQILKTHYLNKKSPSSLKIDINSGEADLIKEKSIIKYLTNPEKPNNFDPFRLEFYVYLKMHHNISKGRLCCNDSISFSDLDYDLVPEALVDDAEEIAAKFGYSKIPIYCDQRLDDVLESLDKALLETNANIANEVNKHIAISKNKEGEESWHLLYEAKEELKDSFFSNLPKIEIADLLKFIGDYINLWDGFTHIKHKYVKRKKPQLLALNACVLAEAFGITIPSMAEISDLNLNSLLSTRKDFIRVGTLLSTNDIVSNYIYKLPIFKAWDLLDGETLADADGKKHPTSDSTIQSRYSRKYVGKGRGISICSLVANHIVVNSKTIGLNEYEGHGLFDMIYGNKSDIIIDYVTGDNHSINPVNFVVLDSVDVGYLPSIKNIKEAADNISSSRPTSYYEGLIKPKNQINKSLITSNKKWIVRVLLSLIMQENTQTSLIRKLSSHDRYARLSSALYEYNKIFKSMHVLNIINDINLRKAIKAARNRTESYHQLQGVIRKVYHGVFKGKRIIDNNVSAHAVRLVANLIISYNSTILNILYEKLLAAKAPKSVIEKFVRISPVAWDNLAFTGRYNFKKSDTTVNLEKMIKILEEKLNKMS